MSPAEIAARLTPAQQRALLCDVVEMYGPMNAPNLGGHNWGWSGGGGVKMTAPTARALVRLGLREWHRDKYPLGYYRLTPLGAAVRAVLEKEMGDG